MLTDNVMAEVACPRGLSISRHLFDLEKQLKLLDMLHLTRLHVIYVTGKQKIAKGTNSLSSGCLVDGVLMQVRK